MRRTIIGLFCVVALSACSVDPADLPIPGSYVAGDKYSLKIEFASVLNLPEKAKVIVEGVDAGVLDTVELVGSTAVATVDLSADVQLPTDTVAELRQSSILGEIYISLQPPSDANANASSSGPYLRDGDVIPVERTVPADNVEDVLRGLSNLVTGGRYVQLQEAVNNVNAAVPPDPAEVDKINLAARTALTDIGDNTGEIDRILAAAEGISNTVVTQRDGLERVLELGPRRSDGLSEVLFSVVHMIFMLGYMSQNVGDVLSGPYPELRDAVDIIAPALITISNADTTVPMNMEKANTLLRERLIPYFESTPNIAVRSVSTDQGAGAMADEMIGILRGIGIVR
ncbi:MULTISPECIES: MlaD family protein [unclassified Rhodococcus (in: high G+C Gram-positive bacteria)]|uniref:MlaD family protein n=1 Tax=unclassified Rhodococcus (in: high G+C Gram-positive bacteria) TaxID=192944 RepID=UPI001483A907|nr:MULTISPECIES: MlaD family protein [unclassified Rhodococcus (in: high G+C Gram-positive bacteria)]